MKNRRRTSTLLSTLALVATTAIAGSAQANDTYEDTGFIGTCSAGAPLYNESINTTAVSSEAECGEIAAGLEGADYFSYYPDGYHCVVYTAAACKTKTYSKKAYKLNILKRSSDTARLRREKTTCSAAFPLYDESRHTNTAQNRITSEAACGELAAQLDGAAFFSYFPRDQHCTVFTAADCETKIETQEDYSLTQMKTYADIAAAAQVETSYEDIGFRGTCSTATPPLYDESVNTTPVSSEAECGAIAVQREDAAYFSYRPETRHCTVFTESACDTKIATDAAYKLKKLKFNKHISPWRVNLIEAEDFDRSDSIVCGATSGFTTPSPDCADNPGIVGSTKTNTSLEYDVHVMNSGTYQIAFRYAADTARPMDLTVTSEHGTTNTYSKLLNNTTGGWLEANQKWQLETQTIELTAGNNTIKLQTAANGGNNIPSLDAMTITKTDLDICNERGVIKKDSLRGSSCNPSETLWGTGHNLCITFYEHGGYGGAGYEYCSGRGHWSGTFNNDTFGSVIIDNGLSVTAWRDWGRSGDANGWSTNQANLGWLDDEISSVRANVPHISAMPAILTHDAAKKANQDKRKAEALKSRPTGFLAIANNKVNLIEAEDFDRSENIVCGATTGFTTPYPDCADNPGVVGSTQTHATLEYDLEVQVAGNYEIGFRYAAGTSRPMDLTVTSEHGTTEPLKVLTNTTGGWGEANQKWQKETQTIFLAAGENTLKLQTSADGGNNLPALDAIVIAADTLEHVHYGLIEKFSLRDYPAMPSDQMWRDQQNLSFSLCTELEFRGECKVFSTAGVQLPIVLTPGSGEAADFKQNTIKSIAMDERLQITACTWSDSKNGFACNSWNKPQQDLGWLISDLGRRLDDGEDKSKSLVSRIIVGLSNPKDRLANQMPHLPGAKKINRGPLVCLSDSQDGTSIIDGEYGYNRQPLGWDTRVHTWDKASCAQGFNRNSQGLDSTSLQLHVMGWPSSYIKEYDYWQQVKAQRRYRNKLADALTNAFLFDFSGME